MFDELSLAPRIKGRTALNLSCEYLRDLVPADLNLLSAERGTKPPAIKQLRDRHHSLARCLAQGMKDSEASAVTGYDPSRISILKGDPMFRELVAHYAANESAAFADFQERATTLAISAMAKLQDSLENEDEAVSDSMALEIAKFAADRTGNAPVAKSINVSVNTDLGNRLAAARKRVPG